MHKLLTPFDRMVLRTYLDFYRARIVDRAEYMAAQTRHRPRWQPRLPAEPMQPRKRRALAAAGPRKARR